MECRSHECKDEGYEVDHGGKTITVFSAPNYCDQMGNKGALIHLDKTLQPKFTTFSAVPHPNVRPMAYAGFGGGFNLAQVCMCVRVFVCVRARARALSCVHCQSRGLAWCVRA